MELWSVVRAVRAAAFAATCAGLAAAGHLAAGGKVAPPALAAGLAVMFVAAFGLTRRERALAEIVPAVAVCQVALHLLLSRCCPTDGTAAAPGTTAAAPDAVGAVPHAHGASLGADGSSGFGMLLMHTVAVLITSWWLESGEAALCAFVRCVAAWALRPLARLRPAAARGAAPAGPLPWARRPLPALVLRHVVARRGPPVRSIVPV